MISSGIIVESGKPKPGKAKQKHTLECKGLADKPSVKKAKGPNGLSQVHVCVETVSVSSPLRVRIRLKSDLNRICLCVMEASDVLPPLKTGDLVTAAAMGFISRPT